MTHEETVSAVADALAELQGAYDDRDRALADYLGVGRTDQRCLDLVVRHGPQTATALGERLHLTRGSMTTLVDRLERAGYVRRASDPGHGRRKPIEATPLLFERLAPAMAQVVGPAHGELAAMPPDELVVVLKFLRATLARQAAVTRTWRELAGGPASA